MKKPESVTTLDTLGRVRLSPNFFMRDFLYSEVANFHGIPNIPDDPDLAIEAGTRLCEELLEPLHMTFGRVVIRSAYRSSKVNEFCNQKQKEGKSGYSCADNKKNYARHIWDVRDEDGMGAMACIIVPWFADRYAAEKVWQPMAYWIHDNLPFSQLEFYPKYLAFNIGWHEKPKRTISSQIEPKGSFLKQGESLQRSGNEYAGFPALKKGKA